MSDQIREQELPGIGRRYSVQADGGEVSVVIHHSAAPQAAPQAGEEALT